MTTIKTTNSYFLQLETEKRPHTHRSANNAPHPVGQLSHNK